MLRVNLIQQQCTKGERGRGGGGVGGGRGGGTQLGRGLKWHAERRTLLPEVAKKVQF